MKQQRVQEFGASSSHEFNPSFPSSPQSADGVWPGDTDVNCISGTPRQRGDAQSRCTRRPQELTGTHRHRKPSGSRPRRVRPGCHRPPEPLRSPGERRSRPARTERFTR